MSESVAITLFAIASSGGLLLLPFIKDKFSVNPITNLILKRSCWVIGCYLMSLNAAMMSTIAVKGGLALKEEMFRYMVIWGWAGYMLMLALVFKTLLDVLKLWQDKKYDERTNMPKI